VDYGRCPEGNFRSPSNLVTKEADLVGPAPIDLVFKIEDLGGGTQNLGGNISDLKLKVLAEPWRSRMPIFEKRSSI
jgi:hypothetical protein